MSYVILGRAIKSEYLALGTLFSTAAIAYSSMGGKKAEKPAPGKSALDQAKDSVPINAGSSEEEQLYVSDMVEMVKSGCRRLTRLDSIQKFIAEAEKDTKH